jgi:hypothetical protein
MGVKGGGTDRARLSLAAPSNVRRTPVIAEHSTDTLSWSMNKSPFPHSSVDRPSAPGNLITRISKKWTL